MPGKNRFTGKVVIITGASSGFGAAMAQAFTDEGAQVVPASRTTGCDVTDRAQVDNLIAQTLARHGRIDILINNAGYGLRANFEHTEIADAQALFDTNFFGAFHCVQAVLPHMKERRAGHIINIASVAGFLGLPATSIYSASKAAVIAFTDSLRLEVRRDGIAVTCVCPGRATDTSFQTNTKTYAPMEKYNVPDTLTTDMVVRAVMKVAAKPKPMVIVPFYGRLLRLATQFVPRLVDQQLYKRMPRAPVTS